MEQLWKVFTEQRRSLAEINPLVTTPDGRVLALDAKVIIDDNELVLAARSRPRCATKPPKSRARSRPGAPTSRSSSSTAMSAAWSTAPGSPWPRWIWSSITAAIRPTSSTSAAAPIRRKSSTRSRSSPATPSVKAILFNIFGGITRTDDVANGIVTATRQFTVGVPIVIRLTGTNEKEAVQILDAAGMPALDDMDEAVEKVVALRTGRPHEHLRRSGARG